MIDLTKKEFALLSSEEKKDYLKRILQKSEKAGNANGASNIPKQENVDTNSFDQIPEVFFKIDRLSAIQELEQQHSVFAEKGISNPFFKISKGNTGDKIMVGDKSLINYSSYNYLGFSGHKDVSGKAKEAIDTFGTSVSASRLVAGEKSIHLELEKEIADFLGVEDSIVFVGGHATNVTTIGHLFGPRDLIIHDSLAHNSIVQGALMAGSRRIPFPHNNCRALEEILRENRMQYEKVLIAIEGVYSVDGDIPDLPRFIEIKKKYKVFLLVDEAHSIGVLGKTGRGIGEYFNVCPGDVDLWMGTLSKTLASCGGYIAGSKALVKYLKYTAPGFMFSVGISPANSGAALSALRILKNEPERVARLRSNSVFFLKRAKEMGLNTGLSNDSAVIPVVVGNSIKCINLTNFLFDCGINVLPILYPAVPENESRLRFFITSEHNEEQMMYTLEKVTEGLKAV
ncbi:MAG: aminotransferase class I/II-fold pyridoxal phosphate-dependent enzyme [Candidatus Riflebacteria bacterium]|nr:aminotransferase class I/II-fold pyridoxal phosphate-dependent enzyme [Candidatus Riflebacteria bacterium]